MQFNINRPPRHIRKMQERSAKREWHQKFAWLPVEVDKNDDNYKTIWFEKYWRKGVPGPMHPRDRDDGLVYEKYTGKTYFKKKLNGDFDKQKSEDIGEPDVNVSSAPISNKILKVSGHWDKKYVVKDENSMRLKNKHK